MIVSEESVSMTRLLLLYGKSVIFLEVLAVSF